MDFPQIDLTDLDRLILAIVPDAKIAGVSKIGNSKAVLYLLTDLRSKLFH